MILQSLTDYYYSLVSQGKLDRPGWSKAAVSYSIEIDQDGNFKRLHSLLTVSDNSKKPVPREMTIPAQDSRSSGIKPYFLCDNSSYILGISNKDDIKKTIPRFSACKELHLSLLKSSDSIIARAVVSFFEKWKPEEAINIMGGDTLFSEIQNGTRLVFMVNGCYPQDDETIRQIWQNNFVFSDADNDAEKSICLISGESVVPLKTHPLIKGVPEAQSSGAAIVSFNSPAFQSYGKEQNENAPVGKSAAFAYTSALNYLINDREHRKLLGDMVIIYWTESGEKEYQDLFSVLMDFDDNSINEKDLNDIMEKIVKGQYVDVNSVSIDPNNTFFLMGISPNAGRLSVRLFYRSSFGKIINNLYAHYKRIELINQFDKHGIPLWRLLQSTVNDKSKDKKVNPKIAGESMRAILEGTNYPESLFQQVQLRIKADRNISWERMAIVKSYILKNSSAKERKEGMTVELNDNTTYMPYLLGRLFSVLESIQQRVNPNLNSTIKDKYFSSACATPAVIFPILINLKDKHLRKLDEKNKIYFERQLEEIISKIDKSYPAHMSLQDQGVFQIGYYHQTQKKYNKQ